VPFSSKTLSSSNYSPLPSVAEFPATAAGVVAIGTVSATADEAAQTITKHTVSVEHKFHQ